MEGFFLSVSVQFVLLMVPLYRPLRPHELIHQSEVYPGSARVFSTRFFPLVVIVGLVERFCAFRSYLNARFSVCRSIVEVPSE